MAPRTDGRDTMALLIDTPRWWWRGRLWAHLVSDQSLDELHQAARALSLRWVSFGRDHYDVPDTLWPAALEVAELVDSREIVRSLRASGLRVPGGKPHKAWRAADGLPSATTAEVADWLDRFQRLAPGGATEVLERPGEAIVLHLFDAARRRSLDDLTQPPPGAERVVETVADGRWSVELVLEAQQSSRARSTTPTRPLR